MDSWIDAQRMEQAQAAGVLDAAGTPCVVRIHAYPFSAQRESQIPASGIPKKLYPQQIRFNRDCSSRLAADSVLEVIMKPLSMEIKRRAVYKAHILEVGQAVKALE